MQHMNANNFWASRSNLTKLFHDVLQGRYDNLGTNLGPVPLKFWRQKQKILPNFGQLYTSIVYISRRDEDIDKQKTALSPPWRSMKKFCCLVLSHP